VQGGWPRKHRLGQVGSTRVGHGWGRVRRDWGGAAGAGWGGPRPGGAVRDWVGRERGRAWPGWQREEHLAAAARMEVMCVREKREKERAEPGTILAYVHRADTSANEARLIS
jgi:hypothetical protein